MLKANSPCNISKDLQRYIYIALLTNKYLFITEPILKNKTCSSYIYTWWYCLYVTVDNTITYHYIPIIFITVGPSMFENYWNVVIILLLQSL